jgi:hypothetical protein
MSFACAATFYAKWLCRYQQACGSSPHIGSSRNKALNGNFRSGPCVFCLRGVDWPRLQLRSSV